MKRLTAVIGAPLLAVMMLLVALGILPQSAAAVGEPPAGTTQSIQNYTLYAAQVITVNGTIYSDARNFQFWNSADVFVTADVASGGVVTVTAQASADGTNFADADYEYADADSLNTQAYQRVLSADGTDYMRLPMAGQYLRVSIATTGTVTPTIIVTMRNN